MRSLNVFKDFGGLIRVRFTILKDELVFVSILFSSFFDPRLINSYFIVYCTCKFVLFSKIISFKILSRSCKNNLFFK